MKSSVSPGKRNYNIFVIFTVSNSVGIFLDINLKGTCYFSLSMFVSVFYLLSVLISLSPVSGTAIKDAKYDEERNYALLKHNYVSIKT